MECKLNNIIVNYYTYGEGRPILMLHGFYPDHRLMEGCMEPIFTNRSGWQRIYLDLPGKGKTKGESWIRNSDDILNIVVDFVEKVIPNQHFSIIGESYGGYLAQGLVTRKYELIDGLVLICPVVIANSLERTVPEHKVLAKDIDLLSSLTKEETAEYYTERMTQMRDAVKTVGNMIDKASSSIISSVDKDGFPNTKAMLPPRKRESIKFIYFSTNTSSMRVKQYLANPKACVYFYDKRFFRGVMLKGTMEILQDGKSKEMIWREGDEMYYHEGVTDPDYCVLRFTAQSGRYYSNFKSENFEVG